MRKSDLKGCTKPLVRTVHERSIQNKHIKCNIYQESPLCRMCGTKNETFKSIWQTCPKGVKMEA